MYDRPHRRQKAEAVLAGGGRLIPAQLGEENYRDNIVQDQKRHDSKVTLLHCHHYANSTYYTAAGSPTTVTTPTDRCRPRKRSPRWHCCKRRRIPANDFAGASGCSRRSSSSSRQPCHGDLLDYRTASEQAGGNNRESLTAGCCPCSFMQARHGGFVRRRSEGLEGVREEEHVRSVSVGNAKQETMTRGVSIDAEQLFRRRNKVRFGIIRLQMTFFFKARNVTA